MQKILLIEDDPLIFRLYKKLFKHEGFEVELAENGQLGLDKLQTYHPDIILLDIMMKTLNGLETITKLKTDEATKHIPVVVLTNISDTNITSLASARGAELVLIKSEKEPAEVARLVRGVLAQAAQRLNSAAK